MKLFWQYKYNNKLTQVWDLFVGPHSIICLQRPLATSIESKLLQRKLTAWQQALSTMQDHAECWVW